MSHRFLAWMCALAVVIAVVLLAPPPGAGQAPPLPAKTSVAASEARTTDGQPNLQGVWTNTTLTSFERPSQLAGKEFFTEKEAAEYVKHLNDAQKAHDNSPIRAVDKDKPEDLVGYSGDVWSEGQTGLVPTRRTSLVVYPPNGIVPLRPEEEKKRTDNLAHLTDSYENLSPSERCITRGVPGGMFPRSYNNEYQILQAPGYVVIVYEMIHEARIIPLDGRPHLPQSIRLWNGDSRGRWEGNTLVVDVTNYNDEGMVMTGPTGNPGRLNGIRQSEALHVVERFTRVDANTINYQATIEDPKVYTSPWKVEIPLTRDQSPYGLFEYACHEGNYAMEDLLKGARAEEKAAEGAAMKRSR